MKVLTAPTNALGTPWLYRLDIPGLGTADVESLTSYLRRLALELAVPTQRLFDRLIRHEAGTANDASKRTQELNGQGPHTRRVVAALIELTGQQDLARTTFLDRYAGLSFKRDLREWRAWCPVCIEADRKTPHGAYDRLLWTLRDYKVCTSHGVQLNTICEECRESYRPLAVDSAPNHCPCGQALGEVTTDYDTPTKADDAMRDMVGRVEGGVCITREQVAWGVAAAVNGSLKRFGRTCGIHQSNLALQRSGRVAPQINALVKIMAATGEDLGTFLAHGAPPPSQWVAKNLGGGGRRLAPGVLDAMRDELARYVNVPDGELPTIKEIAHGLGVTPSALSKRFKPEVRALVTRRAVALRAATAARLSAREERVREAVRTTYTTHGRFSTSLLYELLPDGRTGLLRDPRLSAAVKDEVRKHTEEKR